VTPARSSCPALAKDINLGEIGMSADKAELLQSLRIERSEIGMAADKGELLHSLRIERSDAVSKPAPRRRSPFGSSSWWR